jgi:hypothetical protein
MAPIKARIVPWLVGLVFSCVSVIAQAGASKTDGTEWNISFSTAPSGCTAVCLYRDKKTAGLFSSGDWKTRIGSGEETCKEKLLASPATRTLYLYFDSSGEYRRYEHGSGLYAVQCFGRASGTNYSPCKSDFMGIASPQATDYRVFDRRSFIAILREADTIGILERYKTKLDAEEKHESYLRYFAQATTLDEINAFEQRYEDYDPDNLIFRLRERRTELMTELDRKKAAELHTLYVNEYESALTLDSIKAFEDKYAKNDPDDLIAKLAQRKRDLMSKWLDRYREKSVSAKSSSVIEEFIAEYGANDPEGLATQASNKLTAVKEMERLNDYRERYNKAKTARELQSFISDYEKWDPNKLVGIAKKKLVAAIREENASNERLYKKSIIFRDSYSMSRVNDVYYDCYEISPTFDGRYVRLIDAINLTLRTRMPGQFLIDFESRDSGRVFGTGTMLNDKGENSVSLRSLVIERDGSVSYQKLFNNWLIGEMCASRGSFGPFSATSLGVNSKQYHTAKEIGFR